MFNSLTGIITGKFPQRLLISTGGIEWDVTVPDSSLDSLPPVGSEGKVYVWMQHTDTLMNLFGFASEADRQLFFDLLKVDGIGPKGAVKILGSISSSRLVSILENGDVDALQKVPGVGKKTAGKILLQLKGKLKLDAVSSSVPQKAPAPFADVLSALVEMGYDKTKASEAIAKVCASLSEDASFSSGTQAQKEDAVFRRAIVELS
ncbi:MAG: Holliday junction branch migration protein RuvA [Treponema sp.]|nr:Holliday junction branch migration protein RuvA [Treponema sp.]